MLLLAVVLVSAALRVVTSVMMVGVACFVTVIVIGITQVHLSPAAEMLIMSTAGGLTFFLAWWAQEKERLGKRPTILFRFLHIWSFFVAGAVASLVIGSFIPFLIFATLASAALQYRHERMVEERGSYMLV